MARDMSDQTFVLRPGRLTMADTRRLSEPGSRIALDPAACEAVRTARAVVDRAVEENRLVYGINTGMGSLADTAIDAAQLSELQRRLILSNAAGTGELLPDRIVRRIMLLKINTLGLANSGVRMALVGALIDLFNAGVHPCIPSKGSVGASGDLAPLAHLGAALLGEGEVRVGGETVPAGVTLIDASTKQFLMIDQRRHTQFMIERSQSMMNLGYTRKPIDESAFDWSMLEEVIAEEPELYRSLIVV